MLNLSKHLEVELNTEGVDYFVGDVHGHYDELMNEMKRVGFKESTDRLFFLGDLCNRGDDSIKCLDLLTEKHKTLTAYSLEGNHENLISELPYNSKIEEQLKRSSTGGQWAVDCYHFEPSVFRRLTGIIKAKCFNAITVKTSLGSIGLVHAQAPDDWAVFSHSKIPNDVLFNGLWSHEKYSKPASELNPIKNIDLTISGHTNSSEIVVKQNMIWIDTLRNGGRITIISAAEAFELMKTERANERTR